MAEYSVGEAIGLLMEYSHWTPRVHEARIRSEWELIVGKTIARYTDKILLEGKMLAIYTQVPPLKQELRVSSARLVQSINDYLGVAAITGIVVR